MEWQGGFRIQTGARSERPAMNGALDLPSKNGMGDLQGARPAKPEGQTPFLDRLDKILTVQEKTLFFVGGAPRSGTTWVQEILNSHKEIACRSEALIQRSFETAVDKMYREHSDLLHKKNAEIFANKEGYPIPEDDEADFILGMSALSTLSRQHPSPLVRAVGEKTPENIFFVPRLKRIFPNSKLIVVVRDPRDVLTSAWHFFGKPKSSDSSPQSIEAFVRSALPSIDHGLRATIALQQQYPSDTFVVSYEKLLDAPMPVVQAMLALLGVAASADQARICLDGAKFPEGRGAPDQRVEAQGTFLRIGLKRTWPQTLDEELEAEIVARLGWSFDYFAWDRPARPDAHTLQSTHPEPLEEHAQCR